jgi:hypothetical protein
MRYVRGDCSYSREIAKEVDLSEKAGSWTVNYLPEEGGRYTGTLEVKETGVFFDTLYESSNKTIVKAIFLDVATFAAVGGHTVYRYSNDEKATIDLPASEIVGVEATKSGMTKRAVVTMKNDEQFVFDYGMLSVKKLVASIESITGQ